MKGTNFFGADPFAEADRLERLAVDLRRLALAPPGPEDLVDAPVVHTAGPVVRSCLALNGPVYGHPHIRDGRLCLTSEVYAMAEDGTWARTGSRFYRLLPMPKKEIP